jgi:outer membrane protein OmpA-like peptidoglycan-associated protein
VFGGTTNRVSDVIGHEAGLGPGVMSTIMSLGVSALLSFIGRHIRDESMTASSLATFLNREAPGVRTMLPPALNDALATPVGERTLDVDPVVAQAVRKERSWLPWLAVPAIAAALWFGLRPRSVPVPVPEVPTVGTTGTVPTTGVNFDRRFLFVTGSPTLQPRERAQLQSVAVILNAHPGARVTIAGYTDNVGSPASNLMLSKQRADRVRSELIAMGVDGSRLTAEGYGEANPIGDNRTAAGRAMNRRISMQVATEK